MARLIDFSLDSQTSILVEAAEDGTPKGMQHVSIGGASAEKAKEAFDTVLSGIKPIASTIMAQMKEAAVDANEIQVEFGIKLTATAGVVLARASTEGHCKIAITWRR